MRFFLAIARAGSLSAAAKRLHVAQSTVGRRLASLESSLGVRLLNRTPDGYVPTLAGDDVRHQAERVEAEAHALERQVVGHDLRMAGQVRVTCAETIASNLVAPCLGTLHETQPDILIELIPDPKDLSLAMREADISIRLRPPVQHDLVVRRIGTLAYGLYASPGYLERSGECDYDTGCAGHWLITQLEGIQDATQTDWLADLAPRARIAIQTSSHAAALAAAKQGGGLASLVRFCADQEPGLVRLRNPPLRAPIPSTGIWQVVHKDNRDTPRIRFALDHITKWVRKRGDELDPVQDRLDLAPALMAG
ncbi:LysR family transcriptional regulator [Lichenihabitans psoromatis]|uniref:LysR family transcriptional regulator n=1 Tax=Lichenihabitans psoromatis TaxID=2528642 RepID=UPI0013F14F65|nr:LysR family transcriptional regulator [Lichenihabitans psoromatis]